MEKTKVLCLILAVALASLGTAGIVMGFGGETVAPVLPDNAVNAIMDKPETGTPNDRTAIENLYIAQGELLRKGGFVGTSRGQTTSAGIKQDVVNNRTVVNGNVFKEMITVGIVKNAYQLFMHNGNYLYRKADSIKSSSNIKWANTASKYAENDFLDKFGHRSDSLTGYILNDETIVSGQLEKAENGLFQYRYVLDIETAPARMLREMKTNSNLNDYATYVKAEIIVVMDADWQVKTVTTDCKYKVPMFGGIDCVEDITETFSDLTSQDLPQKDFFEQFFDADVEKPPIDKEEDALSILMDMFAPYIGNGNSLNASLVATMDGQTVLNGLVSAKIDIENLENIEVSAKIGDDLFLEYGQGKLLVDYQDFKASTTVDGIMGLVNSLMPQTDLSATDDASGDKADDDILSKFTYSIQDDLCTVSLPLELGDQKLEINIYADVTEDGYKFKNAIASFGTLELKVELASGFEMPEHNGEYPELLGLLDIVKNGVIYGNVNALGTDIDIMFDLSKQALYAHNDDLSVIYQNNAVYAQFGAIKAKLNVSDIDRIMTLLRMTGLVDFNGSLELPQISVEQIVAMLGNIDAVKTDNGVKFVLGVGGVSAEVYLVSNINGWNLDRVTLTVDGNVITLSATLPEITEIPEVDESEYANVMDLLNTFVDPIASIITASSYGADFNLDINFGGNVNNICGDFAYDVNKNIRVNAEVTSGSTTLARVNAVVINNTVYLEVNGIKVAFAVGTVPSDTDLSQIVNGVYGIDDNIDGIIEAISGLINTIKNLDVSAIDFKTVIKQFSFANGELALTVNADFLGLGDIGVKLSVNEYNSLQLSVNGLSVGNVNIDVDGTVLTNIGKVKTPNANDYILNLKGSAGDINFVLSADLLDMDISANVDIFNQTLLVRYINGKIYLTLGEVAVMGNVDELGELIEYVTSKLNVSANVDLSGLANVDLSAETLLKALTVNLDGTALRMGLSVDGFADVLVNFDNGVFESITANVKGYSAKVIQSTQPAEKLDTNKVYIPIEALAKQFVEIYDSFKDIANTGIEMCVDTSLTIDGNVCALNATVKYNRGLYVNANICYNTADMLNVELWLVDNVLYASVGDLKFAVALPDAAANNGNSAVDLTAYKGYNVYLDGVIDVVQGAINKLANNQVDYVNLIDGLTFVDGELLLKINGEQLGLSQFEVKLCANNGLTVCVSDFAIDKVGINLTARAKAGTAEIIAPSGDFTTNLSIKIDDKNTVYANIDLLNGVYNFRLDDMYIMYSNGTVKLNKGDMYISGDVNQIIEYVKKIDDLVNEFSGAGSTVTGSLVNIDAFKNIDVKAIISSLGITTDNGKATLAGSAFGMDFNVVLAYGKINTVTVNAAFINKTLEIESCNRQTFDKFSGDVTYIQIEQVFNDYFPAIERLVHTNSWKFSFDGDTVLAIDKTVYRVASGSYFEFYYKNTEGFDTFKLRAKLDVYKQKADGSWQPFMLLDIVYKDGNIYVTDTGRLIDGKKESDRSVLKVTVSIDTLVKCYGLYDQIVAVVPQIGELVDSMKSAMSEAENNAENISYSTLLNGVSYVDGIFGLDLNGASLLSKLGAVVLSAQTYGNGLSLNSLQLAYDNVSLNVSNLRVYASEIVETDGISEYATVQDINAYDTTGHIDFNSLYELLSSFVITATPNESDDGARSFYIEGNAVIKLTLGFDLADINMGLSVKVDIDKDNNVYIAVKLTRSNSKIIGIMSAFDDKGGESYLYYDSVNKTFAVIRNSVQEYCTKSGKYDCSKWHSHSNENRRDVDRYGEPSYKQTNISEAEFIANILDYIFEMINLNSNKNLLLGNNSLEGLVKDNIANSNNTNDFGIEDIFTNYSYTANDRKYNVELNLQPIDKNLTSASLNIYHDEQYMLSGLTGNLSLLNGLCKINLDMNLQQSVCGEASAIVNQLTIW